MNSRSLISRMTQVALVLALGTWGAAHAQYGNGRDNRGRGSQDFHFRNDDRGRFQSHYGRDIQRWRSNPRGRPRFSRGQRIPPAYRIQPVPPAYWANTPPPPPGYQYGYYDGYMVAYNPTTRIIADVMDLVTSAINR